MAKVLTLVEDIHVQLLPEGPGCIPPGALLGKRFVYKRRWVVIVGSTDLTWQVRRVGWWERFRLWLKGQ